MKDDYKKSFSEKYPKKENQKNDDQKDLLSITELLLTSKEKFKLKSIDDLNERSKELKHIQKIDVSGNYLSKIILKNFPSLNTFIASKNMIQEVHLNLPQLRILDLNSNLIKSIPDFSKTPQLRELNLSKNLISIIKLEDFKILKNTLIKLDLSYNKINFDSANEFISIVDGLKFFDLLEFSIQGNLFNEQNDALKNSYKTFLKLNFKKLLLLNGEAVSSTEQLIVNQDEVTKQMLLEQDFQNRNKKNLSDDEEIKINEKDTMLLRKNYGEEKENLRESKPSVNASENQSENAVAFSETVLKFMKINKIINQLVMYNGENQNLYFKLLNEVNDAIQFKEKLNKGEAETIKNLYNSFLMNCNELLCLNPKYEDQILKLLAQFSLIPYLNFCQTTLEFLKSYVYTNEDKKLVVKDIIENIVVSGLQLRSEIDYDMNNKLVSFFKETEISSYLLYQNLILNIIKNLAKKNEEIDKIEKRRRERNGQYIGKIRKESNLKGYVDLLDFIIEYLKSENEIYKEKKSQLNEETFNQNNENNDNNDDKKSVISEDGNIDKTDEATINSYIIGEKNLGNFELQIGNDSNEKILKILDIYENYEYKLNSEYTIGEKGNIFGRPLFEEIANKHQLVDIKICSNQKKNQFKDITFIYIFLNILREAYNNIKDCKIYFPSIMEKEEEEYKLYHKKFFKEIELLNTLISTFNVEQYKYNSLLIECDVEKIIEILDNFVKEIIEEKSDGVPYDKIILKSVYQTKDSRFIDKSQMFFKDLPKILHCIGTLLAFLKEREFKSKIDSNILDKYYYVLKQEQADPFILIGTCKLMNDILKCHHFYNNELTFAKVLVNSHNFENLLNYIDRNKKQYVIAIEKIESEKLIEERKEKKDKKYDNKVKVKLKSKGLEFESINSKEIFEFFLSIIDIFLTLSKLNSLIDYKIIRKLEDLIIALKPSYLFNVLGNCLKMLHNDEIRTKAIETLFHSEPKYISYEIIKLILDILKNYKDSVTEGQTEFVLSLSYLTLTNKLLYAISNKEEEGYDTFKQAVSLGINFLDINSHRQVNESKEEKQKNSLSSCIIVFLSSASRIPEIYSELFNDKSEKFSYLKKILSNDYFFFNESTYYPIEIERTYLGNYLFVLFNTMESNDSIPPYSYPFLRILMKISDIIGYCDDASYPNFSQNNDMDILFRKVLQISKDRFFIKVRNETQNWYHFYTSCANKFEEIKNPELINFLEEDNEFEYGHIEKKEKPKKKNMNLKNFDEKDNSNKVDKNLESLILDEFEDKRIKTYMNEAFFPKLSIKELLNEQVNYLVYFQNLFYYLLGENSNIKDDTIQNELKRKYYTPILESEKIFDEFINYKNYGNIKTIIGDIKHYSSEIPFSYYLSKISMRKLKNKDLESYMKSSNQLVFELENQKDEKINNFLFKNDLTSYELYGVKEGSKRREIDENVNNPHLRSLIISCFFRGVYAILISPSIKMRNDFVINIFFDDKYKYLLLYAGTQKMYMNYNMFMIIEKLFNIDNLHIIKKACSFTIDKENPKNNKIKKFNEIIFFAEEKCENSELKLNAELNLFHKYYITALYLEREINKNKRAGLNDLLFLLNFERAMNSFINSYWQINFQYIDYEFRYNNIIKKISKMETFHFLFKAINQLKRYSIFCFNLLKKYMHNYYEMQERVLYNIGIGEIEEVNKFMNERKRNYLLYLGKNEFEIKKIYELLCLFRDIDENVDIMILYILLDLKSEKFNIEKILLGKDDDSITPSDIERIKKLKLIKRISLNQEILYSNFEKILYDEKLVKTITEMNINLTNNIMELIHFKKEIIQKYLLKEEIFIIEAYKCICSEIITHEKLEGKIPEDFILALTKDMIFLIKIISVETTDSSGEKITIKKLDFNDESHKYKSEETKNNNESEKEYNTKNTSFTLDIKLINTIFVYDYSNKLYIKRENGTYFSILFPSNIYTISFLKHIRILNGEIKIIKSDYLKDLITEVENLDNRISQFISNKIANNIMTDTQIIQNAQKIMIEELKKYSKVNVRITNAFEENIYKSFYKNWFINENIIMTSNDYIIYFSDYCVYLISEDKEIRKKINIDFYGSNVKVAEKNIYKILDKIFYADIEEVKNNFTNLKMTIKDKGKKFELSFYEKYEMFLTNVNLIYIDNFTIEKNLKLKKKKNKVNKYNTDDGL